MQLGAARRSLIIDSPPYLFGQPVVNAEELQALNRGVALPMPLRRPGLADAGHLEQVHGVHRRGGAGAQPARRCG